MKILFLDTKPVRRGAQVFLQDLKSQFDKSAIEVQRIFLYREDKFECLPLDEKDFILDFSENHWMEKWTFFQPRLCKSLILVIRNYNPDIILCNGSRTLKYAAIVKKVSFNLKAKWIYRVIDSTKYWNSKPISSMIYRKFIIPSMDAAVGVSRQSLYEMISHYKFSKHATSISRAIDVSYFKGFVAKNNLRLSLNISADDLVLIFIGNLTKQKRPDKFVQIVKELVNRGVNVKGLIVGDGLLRSNIELMIADLNLEDYIHLAGYQKDIRPFLSIANMLLLTSDTEGLPGVVLEAAAMKRISICSAVGGVREFIDNEQTGLVLEDYSVINFVLAIESLIVNPHLVIEMSENAFNRVENNFDLSNIFNKYLSFFSNIVKS